MNKNRTTRNELSALAMRIAFTIGVLATLAAGCTSQKAEPETSKNDDTVMTGTGPTKFATVWTWKIVEKSLIDDNVATQAMQLQELAKKGVVEAIYFDTQPKGTAAVGYPSIGFVVNAKSLADAKSLLDEMPFVQKDIATYALYPVGDRWLEESPAADRVEAAQRYVTVWTTSKASGTKEKIGALASAQSDAVQDLWRAGIVENVYFDAIGVLRENDTQDFVFFVRANTEADAKSIVEKLPFYKEKLADYEIHRVGVLLDLR